MVNHWITHIKQYALDNKVSYKQAMIDGKASYHNPKKTKYEKQLKAHNEEEVSFERDLAKATNSKTKLYYSKIFKKILEEKGIENAGEILKKLKNGELSLYSVASILKPYLPKGFKIIDQEKPKDFSSPPEVGNLVQGFLKPTKLSKEVIKKMELIWQKHTDMSDIAFHTKGAISKKISTLGDEWRNLFDSLCKKYGVIGKDYEALMSGKEVKGLSLPEESEDLAYDYGLDVVEKRGESYYKPTKDWINEQIEYFEKF